MAAVGTKLPTWDIRQLSLSGEKRTRCLYPCCSLEDVAMRTYDFAPLWRSSVGFDRLFDLINETQRLDAQDNYPPCDIVRTGENAYRISVALAGFSPDEISITAQQNRLTVA